MRLIGAPCDAGAARAGARLGPDALRIAGLADALAAQGVAVQDGGNLRGPASAVHRQPRPDRSGLHHLDACVRWCGLVHEAVAQALAGGSLPLLLGGDHHLAMGSIPAVAQHCARQGKTLRVVWLDAHADCNDARSSPSGNIHGMPVSVLLGHGPQALQALARPPLPATALRQVGLRSVDAAEKARIARFGIEAYDMRAIDELGMPEVMRRVLRDVHAPDVHLHLSFDVDFLDPELAPGTGTTARGGPTYREAQLCMEMLADTGCLGSMDLVELNPVLDVRNQTAELVLDLLQSLFGKSTLVRAAS
nr:arginase [Comamonas serinivorans]